MKEVFVLSYYDRSSLTEGECDGVWGVFSDWDKACDAVHYWMRAYKETIKDMDFDEFRYIYLWRTNKSVYRVEKVTVDDIGEV